MLKTNCKGFTLVEVLISVVIIAMVSITSFMGFYVVSRSNESAHNRLNAVTLGQAALEEVRGFAKSNFEGLETITFTDIDQARFPGFHRAITITALSTQIKKADVVISWQERNEPKHLNMSALISLSQGPLPANIHGKVTNLTGGANIPNASLRLEYVGNASLTINTTTNTTGDYTFADANGNFSLKPGSWNLTVSCPGFFASGVILISNLESGEDRLVNVSLTPAGPAHIKGKIVKSDVPSSSLAAVVWLYEKGVYIANMTNSSSGFDFSVPFTSSGNRCFTVNTRDTYKSSAHNTSYVGNFCDNNGWGKNYNYLGWSSAVIEPNADPSTALCSNPWIGSQATDRVCLASGETKNLGNIALVPAPMTTLSGYVRDNNGNPIAGASVDVRWHDYANRYLATSGADGHYSISAVPAEQEVFPNDIDHYLFGIANKYMDVVGCCNISQSQLMTSGWKRIGPGYASAPLNYDFVINSAVNCGDVHGTVRDQLTNSGLAGVAINIQGYSGTDKVTDSAGNFQYKCPDLGRCLPATYLTILMQNPGYYTITNGLDNKFYIRQLLLVKANLDIAYDIKMLRIRYGVIRGKVVVAGTTNPILQATVDLDYNSDGTTDLSVQTDSSGNFVFPAAMESWPPPEVVGNIYYVQTVRRHTVTISRANYTSKIVADIDLENGQELDLGTIGLSTGGSM